MARKCMRHLLLALATSALSAAPAAAAEWKPGKPVEFVVPAPAGGSLDRPARLVQKIWQENKLVDVPVNILKSSAEARKHLDREYAEMREILTDLGMAKSP